MLAECVSILFRDKFVVKVSKAYGWDREEVNNLCYVKVAMLNILDHFEGQTGQQGKLKGLAHETEFNFFTT